MENKVNNIIEGEKVSNYRYNISFRKKFIRLFVYQFTVIVVVYVSFMNYIYKYIKGVYFYMIHGCRKKDKKKTLCMCFQLRNNNANDDDNKEQN